MFYALKKVFVCHGTPQRGLPRVRPYTIFFSVLVSLLVYTGSFFSDTTFSFRCSSSSLQFLFHPFILLYFPGKSKEVFLKIYPTFAKDGSPVGHNMKAADVWRELRTMRIIGGKVFDEHRANDDPLFVATFLIPIYVTQKKMV